jgi:hypothetical protein
VKLESSPLMRCLGFVATVCLGLFLVKKPMHVNNVLLGQKAVLITLNVFSAIRESSAGARQQTCAIYARQAQFRRHSKIYVWPAQRGNFLWLETAIALHVSKGVLPRLVVAHALGASRGKLATLHSPGALRATLGLTPETVLHSASSVI